MPDKADVLKVVIDTNAVVSATLFGSGSLKPLRLAWQAGQLVPVISIETRAELLRVLAYDKFKLTEADIARVLALYLPFTQLHKTKLAAQNKSQWPVCRDAQDQVFLDLARSAKVNCLISGDQDLLVLANTPILPLRILKPVEFLARYQLMP
jgi:uncharacterized protein